MHDGFLKAFRKIDTFKAKSPFYFWIKRLFTNHCTDYARSAYKKYIRYSDPSSIEDSPDYVDEELKQNEISIEEVLVLMNELRPDYRLVINLYAVEKKSHEEIAKILGIKEVSSRSKLMRARNKLKELLKNHNNRHE